MNRAEAERLLPHYFSGELTEEERRALMDAVLTDQDIYNAFAEEQVLSELLKDGEFRREVKTAVAPKTNRLAWGLAIAAGLVIALVSVSLLRRVPVLPPQPAPLDVIALTLSPSERAPGAEKTLHFPAGRHTLQLQVDLEMNVYPKYEAVLETDGREPVRTCGGAQTRRVPSSSRLVIELTCDSIARGGYVVTIYGDQRETVGAYSFRVE